MELERLDKIIANQKNIPRSEVTKLIKNGSVTVNGVIEKVRDRKVDTEKDKITVSGENLNIKKHLYIMLNKPQGVVCSTRDGLSPTVLSLLPENLRRKGLFPAGRLDKDTEGFVLITDDGELAHKMLSPKSHVPKVYYCELRDECDESYVEKFSKGITFDTGEKCRPAKIEILEEKNKAYVTLNEGMFHQVKKMFLVVGNEIIYLKRIKIGGLEIYNNLEIGESCEIMHKDVEKLLFKI